MDEYFFFLVLKSEYSLLFWFDNYKINKMSKKLILVTIRHACDEKSHSQSKHIHDTLLCNNKTHQEIDIKNTVKQLFQQGYVPDVIFTSPFLRCKETSKKLNQYIKREFSNFEYKDQILNEYGTKHIIPLYPVVELSRYFTNVEKLTPDISSRTEKYNIPIQENLSDFKNRIKKFIKTIQTFYPNKVVWIITHNSVLKMIGYLLNDSRDNYINISPLDFFVFRL